MSKKLKVSIGDYLIYKTNSEIKLGRVKSLIEDSQEPQIQVDVYSNELEQTGDEDVFQEDVIQCNLYDKQPLGVLYNQTFSLPPKKVRDGGNLIKFYFPKVYRDDNKTDTQPYLEALQDGFDHIEKIKSSFCEKDYEVFVEDGEYNQSSFKKSKRDFDGELILKIHFDQPKSITNALIFAFSQSLWKTSTYESRSDWLKAFSQDLTYEKLTNSSFIENFIAFLTGEGKNDLEQEDEIVCKLIVKEVKRVKCLSLKELKILCQVNGEDYIINEVLPEVVNSVRIKNSIRINPLTGTNAVKKFGNELVNYFTTQKVDPQYEIPLKMFFDSIS